MNISKNKGVTEEDLKLISGYAKKDVKEDEIYTFNAILCDNEIDRDGERFSIKALNEIAGLFKGVTGIFDHSGRGRDQTARIYRTEVLKDGSKTTKAGEIYTYVKAGCYMPKNEKTKDLIDEIELGIKKEVSVSLGAKGKICSVCGKDLRDPACRHVLGETYEGSVCHAIINDITDAYEWSFVAVPAQKNAGVSKSMKNNDEIVKGGNREKINKSVLREKSERDILTLSSFVLPFSDAKVLKGILDKLDDGEIMCFKTALSERSEKLSVYEPSFIKNEKTKKDVNEFKI